MFNGKKLNNQCPNLTLVTILQFSKTYENVFLRNLSSGLKHKTIFFGHCGLESFQLVSQFNMADWWKNLKANFNPLKWPIIVLLYFFPCRICFTERFVISFNEIKLL